MDDQEILSEIATMLAGLAQSQTLTVQLLQRIDSRLKTLELDKQAAEFSRDLESAALRERE